MIELDKETRVGRETNMWEIHIQHVESDAHDVPRLKWEHLFYDAMSRLPVEPPFQRASL